MYNLKDIWTLQMTDGRSPLRLLSTPCQRHDIMHKPAHRALHLELAPHRGGTLPNNSPNPSAVVRCVMTASRNFGNGRFASIAV